MRVLPLRMRLLDAKLRLAPHGVFAALPMSFKQGYVALLVKKPSDFAQTLLLARLAAPGLALLFF